MVTGIITGDLGYYSLNDYYDTVQIEYEWYASYYECSDHGKYSFDMCPQCFMEKFIPWAESNGAKPCQ